MSSFHRTHAYSNFLRSKSQKMMLHVGIVKEHPDDVTTSLCKNRISLQEIYDRSAFLAKYTDVVP